MRCDVGRALEGIVPTCWACGGNVGCCIYSTVQKFHMGRHPEVQRAWHFLCSRGRLVAMHFHVFGLLFSWFL